ncbi:hypothetical protein AcW1_000307 [Taiwanofungus camphoratus]|nr:hypothetical protein AcW1_000307 [Antrodia cinnamomea]
MSERAVGKPWTPEEDNLLIQAVAVHGETDNWKTIALSIPGRTNKACRKRWLHSLSPSIKKSAWTAEEDRVLLSLYAIHHTKWAVIARHIPGRTDDACSKRYREALDPSLKRDEWTPDEDALLMEVYGRLGGKWGQVGQALKRSGLACRNRWRMLERKKASIDREGASKATSSVVNDGQHYPESHHVQRDLHADAGSVQVWNPSTSQYSSSAADISSNLPHRSGFHPENPPFIATDYASTTSTSLGNDGIHTQSSPPFQYSAFPLTFAMSSSQLAQSQLSRDYYIPQYPSDQEVISIDAILSMSEGRDAAYDRRNETFVTDSGTVNPNFNQATRDPIHTANDTANTQRSEDVSQIEMSNTEPTSSSVVATETDPLPESPRTAVPTVEGDQPSSDEMSRQPRSYYRTAAEKARANRTVVQRTRTSLHKTPPRLSSDLLVASDSTILAYVCGHPSCWPADGTISSARFATSRELSDHNKTEHPNDLGGSAPFRCGLAGCDRSWKSINGLQYHLQVSKVHFQQALSNNPPVPADGAVTSGTSDEQQGTVVKAKKTFACPHPQCLNQYKQLSGLRYHLLHGHPQNLPAQLDVVPPALARKMAEKLRTKTVGAG